MALALLMIMASDGTDDFVASAQSVHDEKIDETKELCKDMFEKITEYISGELAGVKYKYDNNHY